MPCGHSTNSLISTTINGILLKFGKRYKDNLRIFIDQWLKLHLGLHVPSNQKILKCIYDIDPFFSVLFYVYYTGEAVGDCKLHEFFISFNMILCITLSVISILPKVQEHLPMSGLLQSSCITLYVLYLTWSAMANSPDDNCKPDFSGSNSTDTSKLDKDSPDPSHPVRSFDTQSIIGLVVFILCVLYSSVKTSSSSQAAKLTGSDAILLKGQAHQMFSRFLNIPILLTIFSIFLLGFLIR